MIGRFATGMRDHKDRTWTITVWRQLRKRWASWRPEFDAVGMHLEELSISRNPNSLWQIAVFVAEILLERRCGCAERQHGGRARIA